MRDDIFQAITSAIEELNADWDYPSLKNVSADTVLFGAESPVDSMGLVALVATIEQNLKDALGVDLVLADDRAFSKNRSPFRSVNALQGYVEELLSE